MNTGNQRSSATPFGAATSTTPPGSNSLGKIQQRKDMTAIAVAHHIPYAAQASISHWQDLSEKAARAASVDGPSFLNVLSTCQLGWQHEPRQGVNVARLAVEPRFWPLYEVVDGRYRMTEPRVHVRPIEDWLATQGRFRHLLDPERRQQVRAIQERVDTDWQNLLDRCAADAATFGRPEAAA